MKIVPGKSAHIVSRIFPALWGTIFGFSLCQSLEVSFGIRSENRLRINFILESNSK